MNPTTYLKQGTVNILTSGYKGKNESGLQIRVENLRRVQGTEYWGKEVEVWLLSPRSERVKSREEDEESSSTLSSREDGRRKWNFLSTLM